MTSGSSVISGKCYAKGSAYEDLECNFDEEKQKYVIAPKNYERYRDAYYPFGNMSDEKKNEWLDAALKKFNDELVTVDGQNGEKLPTSAAYSLFIQYIKERSPKAAILWIYGWYNRENTCARLTEACSRWKIVRIDISDLNVPENQASAGQMCEDPEGGVFPAPDIWLTHPGDRGMKKIAERIIKALRLERNPYDHSSQ